MQRVYRIDWEKDYELLRQKLCDNPGPARFLRKRIWRFYGARRNVSL